MTQISASRVEAPAISWGAAAPLVVFAAGWLALYLPAYIEFAAGPWRRDENAHAPFLMAIAAGVAWARISHPAFRHFAERSAFLAGVGIVAAGLGLYSIGRLAEATVFLSLSQTFVAAGAAVSIFGFTGAARLWFPILLSLYLVIWPSWALDALTSPLKRMASSLVSDALFAAGLPVANAGAVISAGPYQLLVADACSGLNSLIALTAVGAVYLYAVKRRSIRVNAAVLLSLIPIAIAANILRVGLLVLITYYMGYDAGQSFLHQSAGLAMFTAALAGVFLVDAVAAALWEPKR